MPLSTHEQSCFDYVWGHISDCLLSALRSHTWVILRAFDPCNYIKLSAFRQLAESILKGDLMMKFKKKNTLGTLNYNYQNKVEFFE